jgi:hypothetical protein
MNFLAHGALEGATATTVPRVVADSLFASLDENKDKLLDTAEMTVLVEKNLGLDGERAEAALLLMDKGAVLQRKCYACAQCMSLYRIKLITICCHSFVQMAAAV